MTLFEKKIIDWTKYKITLQQYRKNTNIGLYLLILQILLILVANYILDIILRIKIKV